MERAIEMKLVGETWRVYFRAYSIGNAEMCERLREWCQSSCEGNYTLKVSHVRFTKESDAVLFWLAFR